MKKFLVISLTLVLFACGFRPMYSGNDTDIYVQPISGINGIEMRNALNSKFGGQHDKDAAYILTITLNEPTTRYKALERTGSASWQEIVVRASYKLTTSQGTVIATGSDSASESYTFVRYLVASNASYNNAVHNTIRVLAENIAARAIAETQKYESEHETK